MPVTVKQAIEDYLASDRLRRRAARTQNSHRRTMRMLLEVCGPRMLAPRLSRVEIDRVIAVARARLAERGPVKEYCLNVYRAALKGFVRFCHLAGYIPATSVPTADIEYEPFAPDNPNKRKPLSEEQTLSLFDAAGRQHPRDRAGVVIMTFTGMRESELVELRWRDILWEDGEIKFYRKKVKDWHTAPFTPMLEVELRRWQAWYREQHPEMNPDWYVIPARRHGNGPAHLMNPDWPIVPARRSRFADALKGLLAEIGITDLAGKGAHTLRRTYANLLYELTGDLRAVQEGLGHSNLAITEVYMDKSVQREKNRKHLAAWELKRAEGADVIPIRRAS